MIIDWLVALPVMVKYEEELVILGKKVRLSVLYLTANTADLMAGEDEYVELVILPLWNSCDMLKYIALVSIVTENNSPSCADQLTG